MLKKLAVASLALILLSPAVGLVGLGTLIAPASNAECTTPTSDEGDLDIGEVPEQLEVETASGESITLDAEQLTHAATILATGTQIEGIDSEAMTIALMAALTESMLKQLSNTSEYPESEDYPHDGDGSDTDSLGLFQMRPSTGWGTVEELMDPEYQAAAFYGGTEGPNDGSPRGLLDIPEWEDISRGEAAQAVEQSAHPQRYQNYEPAAETILETLTEDSSGTADDASAQVAAPAAQTVESSRVVFPLPEDSWVLTDEYGPRTHPTTGDDSFHAGTDFAAPDGTEILAAADGTVTQASYTEASGGKVVVEHTIDGQTVATVYIHSWEEGIHVAEGDEVTAGEHIADVGSSGQSTGPHLHFEVHEGGTDGEHTDPAVRLNDHSAADLPEPEHTEDTTDDCVPDDEEQPAPEGAPDGPDGDPNQMVDDPTSDGQITARMLHVYDQTLAQFPETSWACYSPRPGTESDHPLGRACDVTFGNPIGQFPTDTQRETGWEVTNWLKDHAEELGVDYLIWDGKIWVLSRDDEGWRDYDGGGMHDPDDPTGGHYDHLHISVQE